MPGVEYTGSYTTPRADLGEAFMEYMFSNDVLIGTRHLATIRVSRRDGVFPKRLLGNLTRRGTQIKRAPRGAYERDGIELGEDNYSCKERGHETPVDQAEANFYAKDFDLEMAAGQSSLWKVLIDQEIDIAGQVFDGTTNFTVGNGRRTNVTTVWSNIAATIIADVQDAIEKVRQRKGVRANTFTIGAGVIPFLLKNTGIRAAILGGNGGNLTIEALMKNLAAILGIPKILVGGGIYNSANKGVTPAVPADVWSTTFAAVALTAEPGDPITNTCVGRTLVWIEDVPDESAMMEEYPEPQTRSKVIRARSFAAEKMIDLDAQQLLQIT